MKEKIEVDPDTPEGSDGYDEAFLSPKMLLLEEATLNKLPTHIHQAFESLRKNRLSKTHVLRMLVYIVSLESGFHSIDNTDSFNNNCGCFNLRNVKKNIAISEIPQDETVLMRLSLSESTTDKGFKLLSRDIGDGLCITFSYEHQPEQR
ncbi:hypothetical protein Bhyg_08687 [Pseudolycoriella hygida]|uniref:Uncharacterized protein n=1 Tax=Pseudolycoriella hygida TaxID=35572 RepID=A0A9Q0S374_9DIPT|nr:hypothetical protein Bhyg_08687 [Pseudolycoriella hygida]